LRSGMQFVLMAWLLGSHLALHDDAYEAQAGVCVCAKSLLGSLLACYEHRNTPKRLMLVPWDLGI